jgi:hypothetical protein
MELQQHDFKIVHRPGKQNQNADALFRIPTIETTCYMAKISQWTFFSEPSEIIIDIDEDPQGESSGYQFSATSQ